jgi:aminoglycoside phosphotransferase (APT) family kinase protein
VSAAPLLSASPAPDVERAQVDAVLQAGTMRDPLLDAFALPRRTPCHVVDAKYEPGACCTVLYQVGEQLITGVLAFDRNEHQFGGGVVVGPGMRAFLFPDDPALPGLGVVMDPRRVTQLLGEHNTSKARVTLLRYRPSRRATIRIEMRTARASIRLIAKVYNSEQKAVAVYGESRAIARALEHVTGVQVAPAEALLPDPAIVFFRPLAGGELEPHLDTSRGVSQVRAAAAALAALHALPPLSARERRVGCELERFQARSTSIARVMPDVGRWLIDWTAALEARSDVLAPAAQALVHGDCKPSQFRVCGRQLALLDFDHCGVADPASDVGTFLASLRQHGRRSLEAPFLAAYSEAAAEHAMLPERVAWYESAALLRKALRAFARSPRSPVPAFLAREGLQCVTRPPGGPRWL